MKNQHVAGIIYKMYTKTKIIDKADMTKRNQRKNKKKTEIY